MSRHRIDVLVDLAALNHRLDDARKESERIAFVLKATKREVVDAASKGAQPSRATLRTLAEFSALEGANFAELVAAQYDHGDKAHALRAELERATGDPAGTYDAMVAALTERFGTPDAQSPWPRKDGRGTYWTLDVWSEGSPRWRLAWASLGVVEEERGTFVFVNGHRAHGGDCGIPHTFVALGRRLARETVSGTCAFHGVRTAEELVQLRDIRPAVASAAVALAAVDEAVRCVRDVSHEGE